MGVKRAFFKFFSIKAIQIELYINGDLITKILQKDKGQDLITTKSYGSFTVPKKSEFNDGKIRIIRYEAGSITHLDKANKIIIEEKDGGVETVASAKGVNPLNTMLLKAMLQRESLNKVLSGSKTFTEWLLPVLILGLTFGSFVLIAGIMFGDW